jgi:predicted amidophosphoribosyltransferase
MPDTTIAMILRCAVHQHAIPLGEPVCETCGEPTSQWEGQQRLCWACRAERAVARLLERRREEEL